MKRYVTLHGHFYQPPRENPWLEAIEREDSAHPFHDWNARITAECYAPNALARLLDDSENIIRIVNNYARISFNFGPTLLSWMERQEPAIYAAILAADRESIERFSGHGSAIAQGYSHLILPLASPRDRATQVRWGIADFEHRFGRSPEGMWLPETAVDTATLETLAAEGIRYTILAPRQAKAVRAIGSKPWVECAGRVDPSMAYTVPLPSGASIVVFFYDGPISQGIAFEGLLHRGEHLAHRLLGAFSPNRPHEQLVHVATDGETYGHHHRRGEMALAYALSYLEENSLATLTNYGEFLATHPPTHEAQVFDNSSWSCAHGVERWRADCGCSSGGKPGWNQAWRAPLRAALDWLRDEVTPRFELLGSRFFTSVWAARDAYVGVVLDRSRSRVDAFFAAHASHELSPEERSTALRLLELSRNAMLMYTSCGWFFDDVSGIEATQVLAYAGRVAELAGQLFDAPEIEPRFLSLLEKAKSNLPEMRDARAVFEKSVRPSMVDLTKVAAHYAMTSLFAPYAESSEVHAYAIAREAENRFDAGSSRALVGRATVSSRITEESRTLTYAALFVGDHNLHAGVRELRGAAPYDAMLHDLSSAFELADLPDAIRVLDRHFGQLPFTMRALFRDEKRAITHEMLSPTVREAEAMYRGLYDRHAPLMRFLAGLGVPLPRVFRATSEIALHSELRAALVAPDLDPPEIRALLEEARAGKIALDEPTLGYTLGERLHALASELSATPDDLSIAARLSRALEVARALPFNVSLWEAQNAFYHVARERLTRERARAATGDEGARAWVTAYGALGDQLRVKIVLGEAAPLSVRWAPRMLGILGRATIARSREIAAITLLPYAAMKGAVIERGRGQRLVVSQVASQVYFTAIEPLPVLLLIAVTCGFFAIVLADFLMRPNGLAPYIPVVVAQAIVRELLPLVIALILVGRSGTAIATELGYMRVNSEIDALDASGINIDYYLVLPRILGVTLSSIALTVTLSAAALMGGFVLGESLHLVSVGLRFREITLAIGPETVFIALAKATVFGVVIATVNCFHGLGVGHSFTEIPRANVRGAVQCYVACFTLNAALSVYALAGSL